MHRNASNRKQNKTSMQAPPLAVPHRHQLQPQKEEPQDKEERIIKDMFFRAVLPVK